MKARKATWSLLVAMAVFIVLPLVGHWSRRSPDPGCALDGMPIAPLYRVEVSDAFHRTHVFCSPRCAMIWLSRQPPERQYTVQVTDEASGAPLDARSAWYVRSSIVTSPGSGNRIHVFRHQGDAERHGELFQGSILSENERPFQ